MLNKDNYLPVTIGMRRPESNRIRREREAQERAEQAATWKRHEHDRAVARAIADEIRMTDLQAKGAMELAKSIMEGVVDLDLYRRYLAKEDVTLNLVCSEIEAEGVQQVKRIQRSVFNPMDA